MSRTIGYVRAAPRDEDPAAQEAQLRAAGAELVFVDHARSTRLVDRPQWTRCRQQLRRGDVLIVQGLDRVAGSEAAAVQALHDLIEHGIAIKSLTEPAIDTTTTAGRAAMDIVAVLARLRGDSVAAATRRGLARARAQGRVGGRRTVMTPERVEAAVRLRGEGKSYRRIAAVLDVGEASVRRALDRLDTPAGS